MKACSKGTSSFRKEKIVWGQNHWGKIISPLSHHFAIIFFAIIVSLCKPIPNRYDKQPCDNISSDERQPVHPERKACQTSSPKMPADARVLWDFGLTFRGCF